MRKRFVISSLKELDQLIRRFIPDWEVFSSKRKTALVIALSGNLGAGKTTFTQRFLRQLGVKRKVVSPSFVLLRDYALKDGWRAYHFDAWRINAKDFRGLGASKLFRDPCNLVLIEWAERVRPALPRNAIWLKIEQLGEKKRRLTMQLKSRRKPL